MISCVNSILCHYPQMVSTNLTGWVFLFSLFLFRGKTLHYILILANLAKELIL